MTVFECDGWWEQDGFGRQPMEQLQIEFEGAEFRGAGTDIVGPFTLAGQIGEEGAVAILKRYVGRHSVDYFGTFDGEGGMHGQWQIGPYHGGQWAIKIRRSSDREISS